jgi:CheY-like chemotaxis protein
VRVLVVEDDPVTQAMLVDVLEEAGHEVSYATTGYGALAQVANRPPDVMFLDLYLAGGMSGREVLRKLSEAPVTESLPVVVLTASRKEEVADLRSLRNVFVREKPVDAGQLLGLLKTLARGGVR